MVQSPIFYVPFHVLQPIKSTVEVKIIVKTVKTEEISLHTIKKLIYNTKKCDMSF